MKHFNLFLVLSVCVSVISSIGAQNTQYKQKLDSIVVSDFTKYEYLYNDKGQVTFEKFYVATDSINKVFRLMHQTEHTYVDYVKTYSTNSYLLNGTLSLKDRTAYEYNYGILITNRDEIYSKQQWVANKKTDFTYNEYGLAKIEGWTYKNGQYVLNSQTEYHYFDNGKLQSDSSITLSNKLWKNSTKTEYLYTDTLLTMVNSFTWNDTISGWKPTTRKEYIYDNQQPYKVTYKEWVVQGNTMVATLEKRITLDAYCPANNLIMPCDNNLPYKVQTEQNLSTQKVSRYYYSDLKGTGVANPAVQLPVQLCYDKVRFVLQVKYDAEITSVRLLDISGKCVLICENGFNNINLSMLRPGVYFVQIYSHGVLGTLKLIK